MIQVTYTHRNGVRQLSPVTLAIDPEKIVSVKESGYYALIEYGETYDRRRQPVVYRLTASAADITLLILGSYDGKEVLTVTVLGSNTDDYKPYNVASYAMDLQEKYIVDIREAVAWINQTKVACRRIEFVPASFVPVVIFVEESLEELITDTPMPVTTTTGTDRPDPEDGTTTSTTPTPEEGSSTTTSTTPTPEEGSSTTTSTTTPTPIP